MNLFLDIADCDKLIFDQRKTIRDFKWMRFGQAILGIGLISLAFVIPILLDQSFSLFKETFSGIFGIGGTYITSLASRPNVEIGRRKDRIKALEIIKEGIRRLDKIPKSKKVQEEKKLEELIQKFIEGMF